VYAVLHLEDPWDAGSGEICSYRCNCEVLHRALSSAATELDRFASDPGGLINVHDGIDVEVEENVEDRPVTRDRCDVLRLNEGEVTVAVDASEESQEILPSVGDHSPTSCKDRSSAL
jgi:hypothetical protein